MFLKSMLYLDKNYMLREKDTLSMSPKKSYKAEEQIGWDGQSIIF